MSCYRKYRCYEKPCHVQSCIYW